MFWSMPKWKVYLACKIQSWKQASVHSSNYSPPPPTRLTRCEFSEWIGGIEVDVGHTQCNTTVFHGLRYRSGPHPANWPSTKPFVERYMILISTADPDAREYSRRLTVPRNLSKLAGLFSLLTQEPSPGAPRSTGMPTSASTASPPATSGAASAPTPDRHTTPLTAAA